MRELVTRIIDSRLVFTLIGVSLVAVNGALLVRNRELNAEVERLSKQRELSLEAKPGSRVASLQGHDFDGRVVTVPYSGQTQKTLLLVFSPTCRACTENWPNWQRLMAGARGKARIIGVDLTNLGTREYMKQHGAENIQVVTDVNAATIVSHSLALTPQTLVVDAQGAVERVWSGTLRSEDVEEVLTALDAPGVVAGLR